MSQLFRTKSVEQSMLGHGRSRPQTQAEPLRLGPDRLRRRRRDRRRHLHPDGARSRRPRPARRCPSASCIAAIACGLAAMCYAEFASTVPVAGSAYTFSYATLGELIAWIIGWDLVLELALGAAVVSKGWSAYLGNLFTSSAGAVDDDQHRLADVDWGAMLIVAVITCAVGRRYQAVGQDEHGDHQHQGRGGAAGDHRRVLLLQRLATCPFIPPAQPSRVVAGPWTSRCCS